jgi:transposase
MRIEGIEVERAIESVKKVLDQEAALSSESRASLETLLSLVTVLLNRITLNSKNSSKPPSTDPNRKKQLRRGHSENKAGGQKGHRGRNLKPVEDPDEIVELKVDPGRLPAGSRYRPIGHEPRQVIDLDIARFVVEYRAEIIEDEEGKRYTARFPEGVSRPVQYGNGVKAQAVYLSQFQLLPYDRVVDQLKEQMGVPISSGSLYNFNQEACQRLAPFEAWLVKALREADCAHADETGINIDGKRHWLHCLSDGARTFLYPHAKRGVDAMNEMGVLPHFNGVLVHDHWKPYYSFTACLHALCNAHHLRELERAAEQDGQQWANDMQNLLLDINHAVHQAGDQLAHEEARHWREKYRKLLEQAEVECPPPDEGSRKGKRGRIKRSKARNLLERLRDYEEDTLRFMEEEIVPFTNNRGENDLRMTKVQQKISGCFRSFEGARMFCRIRSYLSTCRKHGVTAAEALRLLFRGEWPSFIVDISAE